MQHVISFSLPKNYISIIYKLAIFAVLSGIITAFLYPLYGLLYCKPIWQNCIDATQIIKYVSSAL
jgi:hypothetical protein